MKKRLIRGFLLIFLMFSILIIFHNFTAPKPIQTVNVTVTGDNARFDINTCSLNQLESIPGIGKTKATNIIEYRNKHGNFKSIDDVNNVPQIGDKTIELLKKYTKLGG